MRTSRIVAVFVALVLAFALAACGSHTLEMEPLDEVSGVKVTAENALEDNVATSSGAITVADGDVIVISPCLDKGSFHLTITGSDGQTVAYDDDVEGRMLFQTNAAPDTYDVEVSGRKATGWMTVFAMSADDIAQQDSSLADALEDAGIDQDILSDDGK